MKEGKTHVVTARGAYALGWAIRLNGQEGAPSGAAKSAPSMRNFSPVWCTRYRAVPEEDQVGDGVDRRTAIRRAGRTPPHPICANAGYLASSRRRRGAPDRPSLLSRRTNCSFLEAPLHLVTLYFLISLSRLFAAASFWKWSLTGCSILLR